MRSRRTPWFSRYFGPGVLGILLSCSDPPGVGFEFEPQQPSDVNRFLVDLEISNAGPATALVVSTDNGTWAGPTNGTACEAGSRSTCQCVTISTDVSPHIPLTITLDNG